MTARLSRPALVVTAMAALAAVGPVADARLRADADQADPAEQLLTGARHAAERSDFSGVLEVTWSDAAGAQSREVSVRSANGVLSLGDDGQVVVEGPRRFLHETEGWLAVWGRQAAADVPSPSRKWRLTLRDGPVVAGRPTREVDAVGRDDGRARERIYFDATTNLLLRRELLDRRGNTVRAVGFVSIGEITGAFFGVVPADAPRAPLTSAMRQPRSISGVAAPFRAPSTAGDGFRLAGRYREVDGAVQLFYSDGLFGVSVFEQEGKLDWSGLPADGDTRTVGGADARSYRTPTGVVTVWESDDVVYTAVADAPADQVDAVLADFTPSDSPSTFERVTSFVLGPFSW
ncbi:MAG TPA: sigma-E factor regulatory protein RseB domain-containing protein [Acidimicrobiia bacterium]|jgi:sigma-E factor negative regulatory protein RseB